VMKLDGRKIDRTTLEHLRITACRRVSEGESPRAVIASMGLCRTTIYKWLKRKRKGGEAGLRRRKSPGSQKILGVRKQKLLRRWIVSRDPRHFGFVEALWSRKIISELIRSKFGVEVSVTTVGRLLASLHITPQRPLRRAYERDENAVVEWKNKQYPVIKARAKRKKALILFLDEAGIQSDAALGTTWGEKGKTPTVRTSGQRQKVNAISAVSPLGEFRYSVYSERFNAKLFIKFLKQFTRGLKVPCFFIVDGHPAHRSRLVKEFVASTKGAIEMYFLPPYAPDLNPDEFVWNHLKRNGLSRRPLRQNESLKARVAKDLASIKRKPALIRSFFQAKSVDYSMN
jgi:transposase